MHFWRFPTIFEQFFYIKFLQYTLSYFFETFGVFWNNFIDLNTVCFHFEKKEVFKPWISKQTCSLLGNRITPGSLNVNQDTSPTVIDFHKKTKRKSR